jgi:hypothetical protein
MIPDQFEVALSCTLSNLIHYIQYLSDDGGVLFTRIDLNPPAKELRRRPTLFKLLSNLPVDPVAWQKAPQNLRKRSLIADP